MKHFRNTSKKWICLFTFFNTKAVHLEFVSSLDTHCCLDAIFRLVPRRGCPKTNLSDDDTNFVGAVREFGELFSALSGTQLEEDAAELGTNWTFNPLGVPHIGGVRQRLLKSCKKTIWNILSSQSLKEVQLTTIISSVEQLPIYIPLTSSIKDAAHLEALTPNHFILGRSTIDYPNVVFNGESAAIKKAFWAHNNFMKKTWHKWIEDCLPQLATRKKGN